jgi:hypothetical protein
MFRHKSPHLTPQTKMNPKLLLGLALVLSSGLLLTGCRGMGTQSFTALAPAQARELEASNQTVLDVTCSNVMAQADYNLWENLSMLAPRPKRWKYDLTLHVERVVKGEFDEKTIELRWLREPTGEQRGLMGVSSAWPLGITNGTPLQISFDGRSGKQLRNLKITVRP